MFSTLNSLWSYHLSRGELDRARDTSETLRTALAGPRSYYRPQNLAGFGMLEWFAGDFRAAIETLDTATRELAVIGAYGDISPMWFVPIDAKSAMHVYLALARFMNGDLEGGGCEPRARPRDHRDTRLSAGPLERRLRSLARVLGVDRVGSIRRGRQRAPGDARLSRAARVRKLAARRRDTGGGAGCRRRAALGRLRGRRRSPSSAAVLGGFIAVLGGDRSAGLPALLHDRLRRPAGGVGGHRRCTSALRGVAEARLPRRGCASTTRRPRGGLPISRRTPSRGSPRCAGRWSSPGRRAQGPSSCGSPSTCTSCRPTGPDAALQEAMDGFAKDAMTIDLERARARLSSPR